MPTTAMTSATKMTSTTKVTSAAKMTTTTPMPASTTSISALTISVCILSTFRVIAKNIYISVRVPTVVIIITTVIALPVSRASCQ